MGNCSISLAHRAVPLPCMRSQISGNPPMPSNKLPSVAPSGRYRDMCRSIQSQKGRAMELPSALYRGLSLGLWRFPLLSVHSPMFRPVVRETLQPLTLHRRQAAHDHVLPDRIV